MRRKKELPGPEGVICGVHTETDAQTGVAVRIFGSGLLMDALSAVPLTAGMLAALLAPTELNNSLTVCLAASAVSVTVSALLNRRWWLWPAALAAAAAGWLAYCLLTDGLAEGVLYGKAFIDWLMAGARYSPDVTDPGFMAAVFVMAVFGITLVLFALIRRFFAFPVLVFLQAGAVILTAVFTKADLSAAVCLGAAGLVILLPRVYAGRIAKLGGPASGAAERAGLSRARMQAVAVPAAVLSVLLALWITPADAGAWKSHRLNVWIEDLNKLFTGPFRIPPLAHANFQLHRVGYRTETGRLGGPVTLNGNLYLSVRAPRPVLLKGAVLDHYDGAGWAASRTDGDFRFNGLLWRGEKREAFDLDKPVGTSRAGRLYKQLAGDAAITVVHERPGFSTLFTAGTVYEISLGDQLRKSSAYFNRRSDAYMHIQIPRSARYTLQSRVWNTHLPDFDDLFVQLEEETRDEKRYAKVLERYTQLPESLPDEVRQTAASVTGGLESPYLKALAVSRWLAENAAYTLEPVTPPGDADFVAHFLETREGYCVYYATAMTVLARCAGLPARYAQGFALAGAPEYHSGYNYQATGLSAHAWSEVYFEGIGWMPFDPLDWTPERPLNEAGPNNEASYVLPSPPPSPPERQPEPPLREDPEEQSGGTPAWLLPNLLIPALYGLYRLALRAGPRRAARLWSRGGVRRRWAEPARQLDALYNDTLRLLALQGLTVREEETLVTFPERVDRLIAPDGVTLAEMADALMRSHFGGKPPSHDEIARACLYHSHLEALTLEHLGKRKYLLKRALKQLLRPDSSTAI